MSEKKKKVFISGPMSGIKDFNKPAFDQAEQWLTNAGFSVFNPARMHFDDAWTHEEIMRIDLAALAQCDYILMLAGFEASIGAMQEYRYAMATGIELFHMSDIFSVPRPVQRCSGCKHFTFPLNSEPCKSCRPVLYTNWEPKPAEYALKKTCDTCEHYACSLGEEPCRPCKDKSNWESKDAEK